MRANREFKPGDRVSIEAFGVRRVGTIPIDARARAAARPGWLVVQDDSGELFEADARSLRDALAQTDGHSSEATGARANLGTTSRRERAKFVGLLVAKARADHSKGARGRTGRELLDKLASDFRRPHIARAASLYALMREKLAAGEKLRPEDWLF